MLRELDEVWFHLMMSGNINHLKRDAVLSIDFLMNGERTKRQTVEQEERERKEERNEKAGLMPAKRMA